MNLQETKLQIDRLSKKMTLTLDNPKSVKLQVKNLTLIQKQLRAIKKDDIQQQLEEEEFRFLEHRHY